MDGKPIKAPEARAEAKRRAPPADVIEAAKLLETAGELAGARTLLLSHLQDWPTVPHFYLAMIGRIALQLGHILEAIDFLTRARDRCAAASAPMQLRRNLGTALLRGGRIEDAGREFAEVLDAGGVIERPVFLAAVAAFHHAETTTGSTGSPSPLRVLAEAELLAEAGSRDLARQHLTVHADDWPSLPWNYHAALGRLALALENPEAAVVHFEAAATADPDLPIPVRHSFGVALVQVGRVRDGGRELSHALDNGRTIAGISNRLAVNAYRQVAGHGAQLDIGFDNSATFVDHQRKLVYVSIPKNACTVMKAAFVMSGQYRDDYLASGETVHRYCRQIIMRQELGTSLTDPDYFRLVVLRNPFRRLLSAYLDKIARGKAYHKALGPREPQIADAHMSLQIARTIREAQEVAGIAYDHDRSISFAEFVQYLSVADDAQLNPHWLPQSTLTGGYPARFTHYGKVECLGKTIDLLASRFGYHPINSLVTHTQSGDEHRIPYSETATLARPYLALPDELAAFYAAMPMPETFYTPELTALVARRYAADIALYESV